VEPDETLTWYEQPLETMTPEQRQSWNATVARQLTELKARMHFKRVVMFAGRELREAIAPILGAAALPRRVHKEWSAITQRTLGNAN
jgi:hypothetical protein